MRKSLFLMIALGLLYECTGVTANTTSEGYRTGDIVFQELPASADIKAAQGSRYSHCGIVVTNGDDIYVYEAIQPVVLTPLNKWINRGTNNHVVVKRLKNRDEVLTEEALAKMYKVGEEFLGLRYDFQFLWG